MLYITLQIISCALSCTTSHYIAMKARFPSTAAASIVWMWVVDPADPPLFVLLFNYCGRVCASAERSFNPGITFWRVGLSTEECKQDTYTTYYYVDLSADPWPKTDPNGGHADHVSLPRNLAKHKEQGLSTIHPSYKHTVRWQESYCYKKLQLQSQPQLLLQLRLQLNWSYSYTYDCNYNYSYTLTHIYVTSYRNSYSHSHSRSYSNY